MPTTFQQIKKSNRHRDCQIRSLELDNVTVWSVDYGQSNQNGTGAQTAGSSGGDTYSPDTSERRRAYYSARKLGEGTG